MPPDGKRLPAAPVAAAPSTSSVPYGLVVDGDADERELLAAAARRWRWVLATQVDALPATLDAVDVDALPLPVPRADELDRIEATVERVRACAPPWRLRSGAHWLDVLGVPLRRVVRQLDSRVRRLEQWPTFHEANEVVAIPADGRAVIRRHNSSSRYTYWGVTWAAAAMAAAGSVRPASLRGIVRPPSLSSGALDPVDVVVFSWQSRHVGTMAPVVDALTKRGLRPFVLDASEDASDAFGATDGIRVENVAFGRPVPGRFRIDTAALRCRDDVRGHAIASVVLEPLLLGGEDVTHPAWETLLAFEASVAQFLEATRPRVFLSANDSSPLGFVAHEAAKASGAVTVLVQHGAVVPGEISWRMSLADHVVSMTEADAAVVATWDGNCRRRVHALGQPRFDRHTHRDKEQARAHLRKMAGREGRVGVFALQPSADHSVEAQLVAVARAIAVALPRERWTVVAAPHPAQSRDIVALAATSASDISDVAIVVASDPLVEYVAAADIVVTRYSTSAIDSVILDVPVIELRMFGDHTLDLAGRGVAIAVRRADDLPAAIAAAADPSSDFNRSRGGARHRVLADYRADGESARRVADLIAELCS